MRVIGRTLKRYAEKFLNLMMINGDSDFQILRDGEATYWYCNNLLHREDGPAIEYLDGDKFWFSYGKYHRINGPAIELKSGFK